MPTKLPAKLPTKLPTKLFRHSLLVGAIFALLTAISWAGSSTCLAKHLVANPEAARLGLERAWFAQVRVDPSQHKMVQWVLERDQIFALTSAGTVQAIDAETGKTLWTAEVGIDDSAAIGIAVNANSVALLGSGRLHLLDRTDGHQLWSRSIGGAVTAAPAMSNNYVFVALLSGRVEGYRLDDPTAAAWQYQSNGHTFQGPTVTGKIMSWPTDRRQLYVAKSERPQVLFRVESNEEIVSAPAEKAPYLYVGSLDGYLYSFHEPSGSEQWRYATGYAITSQPAVVGEKVFVASEGPSLHAVDAATGRPLWQVDGATQFAALGKNHAYGMGRYGALLVIDSETGLLKGRIATGAGGTALVNDQSDRLFLVNDRGLVQCLHEVGATSPTWYRAVVEDETTSDEEGTTAEEAETEGDGGNRPNAFEDVPDDEANDEADDEAGDDFGGFEDEADPFQ